MQPDDGNSERRQNWQGLHDAVTRLVTFNQIAIALISLAVPALVGYLVWDHGEQNKTQLLLVESIAKVHAMDTLGSIWIKEVASKHHGNIACHFVQIKHHTGEGANNGSKNKKGSRNSQGSSSRQLVDNSYWDNRQCGHSGGTVNPGHIHEPDRYGKSQWRAVAQDGRLGDGRDHLAYGSGGQTDRPDWHWGIEGH